MPDLSVVLPVFRTGAVFEELVARLCAVCERVGMDFEIVAVDDACPEGSGSIADAVAIREPRLRVLHLDVNQGQQRAVFRGIGEARGKYVAVLDADLQDSPEDLELLVRHLASRPVEAVFAGRRGMYQSARRMLTSRMFKLLLARMLRVPADAGSFVVMTRRMVDAIRRYRGGNPYLLALVGGSRLPVESIPVPRGTRPVGRSSYSTLRRLQFAWRAWRTAMALRRGIPS
jgi:polyisoprenyl-phosphate glycosyltransferase